MFSSNPELSRDSTFEPTLLGAIWRHKLLVIAIAGILAALAGVWAVSGDTEYTAQAALRVEDPRTTALFDSGTAQRPERYVADQAAILDSLVVAAAAADSVNAEFGTSFDADDVQDLVDIVFSVDFNLITVTGTGDDPAIAIGLVNSVPSAYTELLQSERQSSVDAAIGRLSESVTQVDSELAALQREILALRNEAPGREEIAAQLEADIARLAQLNARLAVSPQDENARADLASLRERLSVLQLVGTIDEQDPELSALLVQQASLLDRQAQLLSRRDELLIDSEVESTGVTLFLPATVAEEVVRGLVRSVGFGAILGLLIGAVAAYLLSLRQRLFTDQSEPEMVLAAPLLATVPDFSDDPAVVVGLPVLEAPATSLAESYTFAAAALGRGRGNASNGEVRTRVMLVTSGRPAAGKTVTAANVGIAAARNGSRTLLVDAHYGQGDLTELLREPHANGASDIKYLGDGIARLVFEWGTIDLVSPGARASTSTASQAAEVSSLIEKAVGRYDIVIIDAPGLLSAGYPAAIARVATDTLVVVEHRSSIPELEDVRDRLEITGASVLGYIYSKSDHRLLPAAGRGDTSVREAEPVS